MPTPTQIKLIHTLKGALTLDDDAYRAVLAGYGVDSSRDLTERAAARLIQDLEGKAVAAGVWKKQQRDNDPQTRKIYALWSELFAAGKVEVNNDKALQAYVKRMTGRDRLRFCSYQQKGALIESLKKWMER